MTPIVVPMTITAQGAIPVSVSAVGTLSFSIGMQIVESEYPTYEGEYSFTPSSEEQTVSVGGKAVLQDIVIAPITQDYGKITWNGSIITVS